MGIYSLAAGGLQRAQQSIAPQIMVRLHLSHSFMSFRFRFLRNPDNGYVDGSASNRDRHFRTLSAVSLSKSAHSPALDCHAR
jgi:hypothetical protein